MRNLNNRRTVKSNLLIKKLLGLVEMTSGLVNATIRDSTAIFIFFCHSRFPLKTVHPFRNFLAVLLPPTLYKVETQKKFWIHPSSIVCWARGGVGRPWIGKRPRNAKVSQDFCPWLSEKEVGRKRQFWGVFKPGEVFFQAQIEAKIVIEQTVS